MRGNLQKLVNPARSAPQPAPFVQDLWQGAPFGMLPLSRNSGKESPSPQPASFCPGILARKVLPLSLLPFVREFWGICRNAGESAETAKCRIAAREAPHKQICCSECRRKIGRHSVLLFEAKGAQNARKKIRRHPVLVLPQKGAQDAVKNWPASCAFLTSKRSTGCRPGASHEQNYYAHHKQKCCQALPVVQT